MGVIVRVDGLDYNVPYVGERNYGTSLSNLFISLSNPTKVLQKDTTTFTLEAQLNFGSSFGVKLLNITTQSSNPAVGGVIRLANSDTINFRNFANSADLTLGFNSSNELVINGSTLVGSVTSVSATQPASGFTITGSPITSTGTFVFALNDDLAAVEGLSTNGMAVRTATSTWATRTIIGTTNRVTVTNGDGIAGNPTIDISSSFLANPISPGVNLTGSNGVATTAMRSDAVLILDQAIAPIWTNLHTFTKNTGAGTDSTVTLANTDGPVLRFSDTDAAVDAKNWRIRVVSGVFSLAPETDALATGNGALTFTRTGSAIAAMNFGNTTDNPTFGFNSTNIATFGGQVTALRFVPSSSTVPTNGIYLPAANTIGFSSNTTARLSIDSTGAWLLAGSTAGTSGQSLTSNGAGSAPTWTNPALVAANFANPSATIGLSTVNGSAITAMRSDGAPALSQAIVPTWTALHTFTGGSTGAVDPAVTLANTGGPMLRFSDTDAPANAKNCRFRFNGGAFTLAAETDAPIVGTNALDFARTGAAWTIMIFGNSTDNPSYAFAGSGTTTMSSGGAVGKFQVTGGSTPPPNGMYGDGANEVAFSSNSTKRLVITSSGNLYGTALHNNATSPTGTTNQYIASGTYTPTATAAANISSATPQVFQWIRVGNVVSVSGVVAITPTTGANTLTRIGISLPIASAMTAVTNCAGIISINSGTLFISGSVVADATNDRAEGKFAAGNTGSTDYAMNFQYVIL